ncbi:MULTISPECIES: hemolysin III family protein [unclassified Bifidobacterium]|uniref:PAQR family membrane homeostasis protein TrhA n=1 Tax=unclassified Bifidobacterium TaxID=2608897 RepID=UPI0011297326|nr:MULTISPECIES: hemolysin III family protein [unclassified Bifidobacterium]TPF78478.1 hemolysin III [Bifidobacterium sp. UTCIF-1]TPF79853.1 hemolysin III [Bifidobacterium sp. UTCIF-24]TPF82231.1 hemolysin III [Bifidobacterium sp. UTCIF-3]TPF84886.1 hemolysin III [Bifidobacterium sp. UTCIF-36]TPF88618.1 hemolysin III [Bifidobacterium sp. UTBIF-56]
MSVSTSAPATRTMASGTSRASSAVAGQRSQRSHARTDAAALARAAARYQDARDRYRHAKAALKAAKRQIVLVDAFGNRKPRLRGWLHLITLPLCIAASIVLICIAPAGPVKAACAVYGASAILLFGNSALLHVVSWHSAKVTRVLCGIDYSNIFLIIAGTNTPVLFALSPAIRRPYLTVIWATAAIGTILHIVWLQAPNWVFTTVYVVLGLAPVTLIPQLWTAPAVGPAATVLIACGGAAYIAGAVCFALRKPNPVPGWFEFHEVFHVGTVIGYVCHVVAIYLIVCAL